MDNLNLGKTQITHKIRVSSAAIWYESQERYQYETFIFSKDKDSQRTVMVIHGSSYSGPCERLKAKTEKIHAKMASGLLKKFNT